MGVPRVVLGGPWGSLGTSQGAQKTEVVHGECPETVLGGPMGVFGGIGRRAILGSVLRDQNVVVSLVLGGFLRCHVF